MCSEAVGVRGGAPPGTAGFELRDPRKPVKPGCNSSFANGGEKHLIHSVVKIT